jgi:tetratricopeptide (TPR) repeat protein
VAAALALSPLLAVTPSSAAEQARSTTANVQEEHALREAAIRAPENLQAVETLGEYYLRHKRWRESAQWLAKAYELSGDPGTAYDLAFVLMQAGDLDGAKRQIELAIGRKDAAKLHNLLGEVDDHRGDFLDAAREYHRAAELEPSEGNIFDLATFLLQHKKYVGALDDSIKFFRYGVAQYPRSSQMMVGFGVALYAGNQYDEAVRVLCAAVDLDPNDRRPIQFLGRASRVSPELGQEVDRRLHDFADRYPGNAATNYFYALSLWERGGGSQGRDMERIEQLLSKAERIAPAWYEPHYQLGVVYEAENRYADAIAEMKRAVKIDDDFFPAHYRLAVLYKRMGQAQRAAVEAAAVKRLKERDQETNPAHDVSP